MSVHPAPSELTREDPARRVGRTVSGVLALPCALLALAGFGFTPWLAYIPAAMALGLFTLVIWLGTVDAFSRCRLALRIPAVLVAAYVSTALFWATGPGWFLVPALWSVLAAVSTRSKVWGVTALLGIVYGTWLVL